MDSTKVRTLSFRGIQKVTFFMIQPDTSGNYVNEQVGTVISWPFAGYLFTYEGIRYMSLEMISNSDIAHWEQVGDRLGRKILITEDYLDFAFRFDYRSCGKGRALVCIEFDPDRDAVETLRDDVFEASESLKPHNFMCEECDHSEDAHALVVGEYRRGACSLCQCAQFELEGEQ